MATQMFEGRGHAAVYHKYRFAPGKELQQTILSYLQEKVSGVQPGWKKNPTNISLWVAVFTLLGVSPWLVPQGKIKQQGSRPEGGTEEAF